MTGRTDALINRAKRWCDEDHDVNALQETIRSTIRTSAGRKT